MMHIPTKDIRNFEYISFATQLQKGQTPTNRYDVHKWLFVPNTYTGYRIFLER